MSGHFSIWIVTPAGYLHSRAFEEVSLSLRAAFRTLGFDAPIVTDPAQVKDYAIVLGANLLPHIPRESLPAKLILYNLEQVQQDSPWLKQEYVGLLRRYPVWDYSARNIANLKQHFGVTNVTLCGIGYMPELSCIAPAAEDIDVAFIGSLNPRRKAVLEKIAAAGKQVTAGYNLYGKERDALIARSKLVLNLHFYDAQIFEIVRVSYLLANRKCVVSETGNDPALEDPLRLGIAFSPYENLADTCLIMLAQSDGRVAIAQKGFELFSAMSQVPMLKRALACLPL